MTVRMTHPDLDAEIVVAASAVPIHRGSGWVPVEGQQDMGEELPAELQRFEGQPPVRMRHPNLDSEITVAESAVPIHRSNGWLVIARQAEAAADLEGLTVAQLQERARDAGLPVSGTKAELLERLGGQQGEQASQPPAEPASKEDEA